MPHTKPFTELTFKDTPIAGGKGASLGEMTQAGIPVPPGFVVLASAFERFLEETDLGVEVDAILDDVDHRQIHTVENASEKIQALISGAGMPDDIRQEILDSFDALGADLVAVRSSATSEDSHDAAWAGQLDSHMNIERENVVHIVQECWASLFTPRAIFYRFEKNLHDTKISVAVVIQKMVKSEVSGIAFSVHPVTEDESQMIIEAGWGFGDAVVSGSITPDSYVVEKNPKNILDVNVSTQERQLVRRGKDEVPDEEWGENVWKDVPAEKKNAQKLSDDDIARLSDIVIRIETHYGFPCDIEWAKEGNEFYITQSRPITTLSAAPAHKAREIETHFVFEELRNANPMVLHRFVDLRMIDDFFLQHQIPPRITKAVIRYEKEKNFIYFLSAEFDAVAKVIVDIFINDTERARKINENIMVNARKLIETNTAFLSEIQAHNGSSYRELLALWVQMEGHYADLFKFTWIHNALDFKDNLFTTRIFNFLFEFIRSHGLDVDPNEAFVILTTPEAKQTYSVQFERELKSVREMARERGIATPDKIHTDAEITRAIKDLAARYGWLGFGFDGPPWSESHIAELLTTKSNAEEANQGLTKKRNGLLSTLGIGQEGERVYELARKVIESTELRKEAMFNYYYVLDALFDKLSASLHIPKKYLRYVYPDEIMSLGESIGQEILEQRELYHLDVETPASSQRMVGQDARNFFDGLTIKSSIGFDGKTLTGQTSYPGVVQGIVKIVNEKGDVFKVNEGDILVSIATNPELISAMKKAGAFVTDRGGITCHAAIVSRELGIPCVIGTKIATQVLKDGDMVEVDADNGVVRIMKQE